MEKFRAFINSGGLRVEFAIRQICLIEHREDGEIVIELVNGNTYTCKKEVTNAE